MTLTVVATPSTTAEIFEAVAWYEAQRDGLGEEFLAAIDRINARIVTNPISFQ